MIDDAKDVWLLDIMKNRALHRQLDIDGSCFNSVTCQGCFAAYEEELYGGRQYNQITLRLNEQGDLLPPHKWDDDPAQSA